VVVAVREISELFDALTDSRGLVKSRPVPFTEAISPLGIRIELAGV
jgi:hypothetical protein